MSVHYESKSAFSVLCGSSGSSGGSRLCVWGVVDSLTGSQFRDEDPSSLHMNHSSFLCLSLQFTDTTSVSCSVVIAHP